MKYTKGKWVSHYDIYFDKTYVIALETNTEIALLLHHRDKSIDEMDANADLLAASPTMLQVLKNNHAALMKLNLIDKTKTAENALEETQQTIKQIEPEYFDMQ